MAKIDPQQKRLYQWESTNGWNDSTISFKKAKSLIISACKVYNVEPPTVYLHTTRLLPYSDSDKNIISMQCDKYLNVPITLHEAAHHIVHKLCGARAQDHGPTFLKIYLDLLIRHGSNMYKSAEANGLRW